MEAPRPPERCEIICTGIEVLEIRRHIGVEKRTRMRRTPLEPRPGIDQAYAFLAEHGTLEDVRAELRRLADAQGAREWEDGAEIAAWLMARDGADYRMTLVGAESSLRAERDRAAMIAKREADAEAARVKEERSASMTVEDRLARAEAILKFHGLDRVTVGSEVVDISEVVSNA